MGIINITPDSFSGGGSPRRSAGGDRRAARQAHDFVAGGRRSWASGESGRAVLRYEHPAVTDVEEAALAVGGGGMARLRGCRGEHRHQGIVARQALSASATVNDVSASAATDTWPAAGHFAQC
jgi:hypothetical protein